eukprot:scaffold34895_cov34-Cyclotella_meneghiniana.AAC.1
MTSLLFQRGPRLPSSVMVAEFVEKYSQRSSLNSEVPATPYPVYHHAQHQSNNIMFCWGSMRVVGTVPTAFYVNFWHPSLFLTLSATTIEIERATPTTNHGRRTDSALTIDPTASITIPQRHYWLVKLYRRFKNDACAPATDLRSLLNCHSVSRVSVGPSVSPNTML